MNTQNDIPQNAGKLKEIPKWSRRYAHNRTLTILVLMAMLGLLSMLIAAIVGFLLALSFAAFRKGNIILGCVGVVVLAAVLAAIVKLYIFMFAKFGGKNRGLLDQIIDHCIYRREGAASILTPGATRKKRWLEITVIIVFGCLFLGTMELGMLNIIPAKYVQPISALYFVPYFVCGWYFWQSPRMGPIYLLGPILYAVHAILILAGVPIYFSSNAAAAFNMALPFIGYSFLSYVIAHFYSRYALKKLKGITHLEGDSANGN